MRLLVFTEAPAVGGAEVALGHLLGALDASIEVTVLGHDGDVVRRVAASRPGSPTAVVPAVTGRGDVRGLARLRSAIVGVRADVFQANLAAVDGCRYGLLAALTVPRLPVVAVVHSPVASGGALAAVATGVMSRRLAAHVAIGSDIARRIEALPFARPGGVRRIGNGVPSTRPPRSLDLPRPVVGTVARLVPGKRIDVLVEAMALLPRASLVVVGDGPERPQLEARATAAGVGGRSHFVGWQDEASEWTGAFDVFVLPSDAEGVPVTVVEAMLAGTPVVATDVGSLRDVVVHGRSGLLVPPGDPAAVAAAVRLVLDDAALRDRLVAGARRVAAERTPEAMARRYEALYREVRRAGAGFSRRRDRTGRRARSGRRSRGPC